MHLHCYQATEPKTSSRAEMNDHSQRCSMKKILLVDDEEQLINIMASVLEDEGFAVKTMLSAEEALSAFASYSPDLVISDVKMERMDGFAMCRFLGLTRTAGPSLQLLTSPSLSVVQEGAPGKCARSRSVFFRPIFLCGTSDTR